MPEQIDGIFQCYGAGATMSDSLGNFLFATNGEAIWNREGKFMMNGDSLKGNDFSSQGSIIVQKPGSENLYYVFTVAAGQDPAAAYGLYYTVVDMNLDNGLGGVTNEKNIRLTDAYDAVEKIVAARHKNGSDIWIITYKMIEPGYAAFLLTANGINEDAVICNTGVERKVTEIKGQLKLSYNKKYLVSAFNGEDLDVEHPEFEILNFDAVTGQIELKYVLRFINEENGLPFEPHGVEFSPDSKLLYLAVYTESGDHLTDIYQLDMRNIDDSADFFNSRIKITTGPGLCLQLATDGKIYGTLFDNYISYDYISVIHKPWERGTSCNYEPDYLFMGNNSVKFNLQNVLLDYLYRFEWQGQCSAEPFYFQSNFQPDPVNIRWSFDDPDAGADSISFDLNPVHYFTHSGEFEVKVSVLYPSGRVEKTSRVVTVIQSPQPDLGPDTLMCAQGEIVLDAGEEQGDYQWWHNGQPLLGLDTSRITVSDTGLYWVQVTNAAGCAATDSIHVGLFPPPDINEDNLTLVPTTCGGSNGKILGLEVTGTEPLSYEWYDADSTLLGTTLDLTGLPVGNYYLHILDGNGCLTISRPYTIEDAGNIQITAVEKTDSHCGQNKGTLTISAQPSENLEYSIDDRNTWHSDNHFENLPAGEYKVWARDPSGCEGVYANNPVVIQDLSGPQVTQVITVPEIDNLSNGEIDITATVESGPVYYSIDNGATFQTDDGHFTNLPAGTYPCIVKDDFGCDTTFTVEVERIISQLIEAIAGDGNTCIGDAAVVPLKLVNFKDIYKFYVTLTYDTSILKANGYINVNPVLKPNIQVSILPGGNEVVVSWQGDKPETLPDNATMLELVFGAKKEGLSGIDWAAEAGQSAFFNEQLEEVNAQYHTGTLRVYTRPEIIMENAQDKCEGETFTAYPFVTGGSGEVTYEWTGPGDFHSTEEIITIEDITPQQAGTYLLTITDTIGCVEKKELNLTVYESPKIAFAGLDTLFAQPGFLMEAGSGYANYLWNTGDTTDAITVNDEGQYWVTVTSTESCQAADTVMVFWGGQPFYLPNAFTPNGDGLNDEFKPVQRYDFVKTYRLSIYNRWGQLIFETSDINTGWDGTYQGKPVEQGTYVYKIVYTASSTGTEPQSVAGNVMVVR